MNRNKILAEKASNLISSNISLLENIGIDHFGYREFIEDGSSIGFCTHQNWSNLQSKMHIIDDMSIHYKRELIEIGDNKTKYLVRCGEVKNQSYFLNVLNNWKLWNSLVIYKREHNKICGYYFISSNENMSVINSYMNNLSFIENIINIIKPKIQSLVKNCNKEFYEQLFDRSEANLIINNKVTIPNSKPKNRVLDKDHYKSSRLFSFSEKQKKIIYLLMQKFSNKKIAKDLGISPRTAEWHIERIKIKTEVKCKQELINFLLTCTFEL